MPSRIDGSPLDDDNLLALWPLDGDSDERNSGQAGIDTDLSYEDGILGECVRLSGNTSGIDTQLVPSIVGIPWSMMMWVKPADVTPSNTQFFIANDDKQGLRQFNWGMNTNGTFHFEQRPTMAEFIGTGASLTTDWQHIALTSTGSLLYSYIDGELNTGPTGCYPLYVTANTLTIGMRKYDGYAMGLVGDIDDVGIFDRCISSDDIKDFYNDQLATRNFIKKYRRTRVTGPITGVE